MENDVNDLIDSLSQIIIPPAHNKRPLFNTRPVPSLKRPRFIYTSSLRLLKLIDAPKVS